MQYHLCKWNANKLLLLPSARLVNLTISLMILVLDSVDLEEVKNNYICFGSCHEMQLSTEVQEYNL